MDPSSKTTPNLVGTRLRRSTEIKDSRELHDYRFLLTKTRGPFLERPGKLTGPVSNFEIEVSRKVGCVLTSNEVYFASLAENFTVNFQKF